MAIKPVLHRILVLPDKLEEKDDAYAAAARMGIEVVRDERDREQAAIDTGTVVSVGATAFKDFGTDSPIKEGDTIVYARYGGKAIVDPADKVKYIALNDEDVIAIITKEGA
jgi:co-chaperonin GroES (HSP10)